MPDGTCQMVILFVENKQSFLTQLAVSYDGMAEGWWALGTGVKEMISGIMPKSLKGNRGSLLLQN